MSADKRTVATDALATLGTIIGAGEKRDAIHLAVEPVIAGENLDPGHHIRVENGVAFRATKGLGLGIVDPFLADFVKKGERFWFIMYPREVKSLRHVWTHPAFSDEVVVTVTVEPAVEMKTKTVPQAAAVSRETQIASAKHRIALIAFALGDGMDYDKLMDAAREWLDNEQYCVQYDAQSWQDKFNSEEFWPLYEIVTGRMPAADKDRGFFSCSC